MTKNCVPVLTLANGSNDEQPLEKSKGKSSLSNKRVVPRAGVNANHQAAFKIRPLLASNLTAICGGERVDFGRNRGKKNYRPFRRNWKYAEQGLAHQRLANVSIP